MSEVECGTYAGYKRHIRRRERTCDPCREANRDYMTEYRTDNPDCLTQQNRQAILRQRALSRLALLHPADYRRIFHEVVARDRATKRRAGADT